MDAPIYSRAAAVGDALYLATARRLYVIAARPWCCQKTLLDTVSTTCDSGCETWDEITK